ncbi:transposase [Kocuria sp. CPCC 205292]|uniref:IS110 family transposase n=1 Tax=Kocuria cellulosilytica TaxID=3071451 RepID=UPI0034D5A075
MSVGLDVHARSVAAAAIDGVTGELVQARLTPDHGHIRSWIQDLPGPVAVAYEAGPTGFGLARALEAEGIRCVVAGPSKLQRPSGDRIKTDARDAVHLARPLRLVEITAVVLPGAEDEAARDLAHAREDCRGDLMRARHRVSKLLMRHGTVYTDGHAWTGAHHAWLARQPSDTPTTRMTFDAEHETVLATMARRDRLDRTFTAMAAESEFTPVVARLCCLRGISALAGFGLAVEIGDWHRFTGSTIGSFVGLVPSEHSSVATRSQGPITCQRRVHIDPLSPGGFNGARGSVFTRHRHHQDRQQPRPPAAGRGRLAPPPRLPARSHDACPMGRCPSRRPGSRDAGNRRLHERWVRMLELKNRPTVANVAVARELAG